MAAAAVKDLVTDLALHPLLIKEARAVAAAAAAAARDIVGIGSTQTPSAPARVTIRMIVPRRPSRSR